MPRQLSEKVDQIAARLKRSRGWVAQKEEHSRLTREALADVDTGQVISHQAVQAWAESLDKDEPLPVPR